MSETVIHAEGLGKQYRVGTRERYLALRDVLSNSFKRPFRWKGSSRSSEYLWALEDVGLEVRRGEILGLIGRNGAGKTTLLKILSRITRPTCGYAEIHGRVGSLLEVGTGFHPELTGRENVYLSGAILGMRKSEIFLKFDEIVSFAGVERFIDTPLKHFSTGMQMRLAFAVAAHLEPEILLVDEVLAVGDLEFQKKCLGKMDQVTKTGRTIVFVSHQMSQIRRLCKRAHWLDDGRIHMEGNAAEMVSAYESAMGSVETRTRSRPTGVSSKARFKGWEIGQVGSATRHALTTVGPVTVRFFLEVLEPISRATHGVTLYAANGEIIWGWAAYGLAFAEGIHELSYKFPVLPLKPGAYSWMVTLWDDQGLVDKSEVVPEMLVDTPSYQHPNDEWSGILNLPSQFASRHTGQLETSQEEWTK